MHGKSSLNLIILLRWYADPLQTEVVGQDGISYAPVNTQKEMTAIREQIAGWNGNPTDEECSTSLAGIGMFEWKTMGEYLDCLERNRTATNVATLVPQASHLPYLGQ
jgi:N-acyl-D-aspartate/D-glutamate deacylase